MSHLNKRDLDHCDWTCQHYDQDSFTPYNIRFVMDSPRWDGDVPHHKNPRQQYIKSLLDHLVKIGRLEQIQPRLPNPTMTFIYRRRQQ
jgi:hypothetical protein